MRNELEINANRLEAIETSASHRLLTTHIFGEFSHLNTRYQKNLFAHLITHYQTHRTTIFAIGILQIAVLEDF